jgi:hypothetical protein
MTAKDEGANMARIRISLDLDIDAEETALKSAALSTPAFTEGEGDFAKPAETASDPLTAGEIIGLGIQTELADKLQGGKVSVARMDVSSLD